MMAKQKAQAGRMMVSVPTKTYAAIERLQRELSVLSGKRFTIGDVVARGAQCLLDAASRNAWLSPSEQEEPLRERVRTAVIANIIALRESAPGIGIGEIGYDAEHDAVLVTVAGEDEPVPLYPDSPTVWAARRRPN